MSIQKQDKIDQAEDATVEMTQDNITVEMQALNGKSIMTESTVHGRKNNVLWMFYVPSENG